MWSVARYDLRLTSEEFYSLTPRQFDALVKRREREPDLEFMLAQLTAYTVNFSMSRPKEPTSAKDFMPSQWDKPTAARKRVRITKSVRNQVTQSWRTGLEALRSRRQH